jgi:CTP synthase (UTP-ammonia lyase)
MESMPRVQTRTDLPVLVLHNIDYSWEREDINEALKHASMSCGAKANLQWMDSEAFEKDPAQMNNLLEGVDGILLTQVRNRG